MKFFLRILLLLLVVTPMVGLADAPAQSDRNSTARNARSQYENLELFGFVYEHLMRDYVDELDPEEVIQRAIDAMLEDLDPHSQLLTPEIYEDLMTSTQGQFGGLGIQIVVRDGYPTVVSPIDPRSTTHTRITISTTFNPISAAEYLSPDGIPQLSSR